MVPLMPVITYAYDGPMIVGLVCETPAGRWLYKELRVEDRMLRPVPTDELMHTLYPYLLPPKEGK